MKKYYFYYGNVLFMLGLTWQTKASQLMLIWQIITNIKMAWHVNFDNFDLKVHIFIFKLW
jgi:hypothetical protein